MKPGGSEGGARAFVTGAGMVFFALGLYLFLDSVQVTSASFGWISGRMGGRGGGGGGMWETTSMGLIFVPFLARVMILFFDADKKWAWWLAGLWAGNHLSRNPEPGSLCTEYEDDPFPSGSWHGRRRCGFTCPELCGWFSLLPGHSG